MRRDTGFDYLLGLDGDTYFIDDDGDYTVKFVVHEVPVSSMRPHGLKYSLTLHGPGNQRIVGFDNAHQVLGRNAKDPHDHRHFLKSVKPYDYADAAALLEDFWVQVERMLDLVGAKWTR